MSSGNLSPAPLSKHSPTTPEPTMRIALPFALALALSSASLALFAPAAKAQITDLTLRGDDLTSELESDGDDPERIAQGLERRRLNRLAALDLHHRAPDKKGDRGARRASAPEIRVGRPIISVHRDKSLIVGVVRAHRAEIKYCYDVALGGRKGLEGRVEVRFSILPDGRVRWPAIKSSTLRSAAIERCILERVSTWRFQDMGSECGLSTVHYPFAFVPEDRPAPPVSRKARREALKARLHLHPHERGELLGLVLEAGEPLAAWALHEGFKRDTERRYPNDLIQLYSHPRAREAWPEDYLKASLARIGAGAPPMDLVDEVLGELQYRGRLDELVALAGSLDLDPGRAGRLLDALEDAGEDRRAAALVLAWMEGGRFSAARAFSILEARTWEDRGGGAEGEGRGARRGARSAMVVTRRLLDEGDGREAVMEAHIEAALRLGERSKVRARVRSWCAEAQGEARAHCRRWFWMLRG